MDEFIEEIHGVKFYVSPALAEKIHAHNIPYRGELVINQPVPKTSPLRTLIPGIWAQTVERYLRHRVIYDWEESLTPEERERLARWRKRYRHYKRKIAWAKARTKKKPRRNKRQG